ncbi:MAG: VOC family protein [Bacteroidetes bacterium]|nr:VOC family protein [Bacteroidota bacterium]MBL6943835.1 VOC family protein [Bacteroidales bacterium]
MKLEHIALTINSQKEIKEFYQGILQMELVKTFTLNAELSKAIFKADSDVPVYIVKNDSFILEIFVSDEKKYHSFGHICISVINRELIMKKAVDKNYPIIKIEREYGDLVFVHDLNGNMFEIKEFMLDN